MITASSQSAWETCKRLFRHKQVDLIRPATMGTALYAGSGWHEGQEVYIRGGDLAAMIEAIEKYATADAWWQTEKGQAELAKLLGMTAAYWHHWGPLECEPVEVEQAFEWEIHGIRFAGKPDALVRRNGRLELWEHKTTSMDCGPGSAYLQPLSFNRQLTLYQARTAAVYQEVPAAIYNVVRKPLLRLKKAETLADYEARITEAMLADPGKYFVRHEVNRTFGEINASFLEVLEVAREITNYEGTYPRNDKACGSWGGCPYLGVCSGVETLDSQKFVQLETAHPELEGAKEEDNGSANSGTNAA